MTNLKNWMILVALFMVGLVSALPIYVSPLDGENFQPGVSFNYTFNFTTGSDCSGVLLSNISNITTAANGVGFVDIDISGLSSKPTYLCEYRNGELRKMHNFSDMILGDVWAEGVVVDENVSVSGWGFFGWLGSVGDRIGKIWADELDVAGNVSVDSGTLFVDSSTDRVGVGTTSPGQPLHVEGLAYARDGYRWTNPDGTLGQLVYSSGTTYLDYQGNMSFRNVVTSGNFIINNGNVGIGTTSPQNKLNVVGDGNFTGVMIIRSMNITVESNGDVNVW